MTCLNCEVEVLFLEYFLEGVAVQVRYRGREHNFYYFFWRRPGVGPFALLARIVQSLSFYHPGVLREADDTASP